MPAPWVKIRLLKSLNNPALPPRTFLRSKPSDNLRHALPEHDHPHGYAEDTDDHPFHERLHGGDRSHTADAIVERVQLIRPETGQELLCLVGQIVNSWRIWRASLPGGFSVPDSSRWYLTSPVVASQRPFSIVNGRREPLIRWEGHYFDRRLSGTRQAQARRAELASSTAGAIPNPLTQTGRWKLFERAAAIDRQAAVCPKSRSIAWPALPTGGSRRPYTEIRTSDCRYGGAHLIDHFWAVYGGGTAKRPIEHNFVVCRADPDHGLCALR